MMQMRCYAAVRCSAFSPSLTPTACVLAQLGRCRVLCSTDVPNLSDFLKEQDTYFYRYEYHPALREKGFSFTLPGGKPLSQPSGDESLAPLVTDAVPALMPPPASKPGKRAKQEPPADAPEPKHHMGSATALGAGRGFPGLGCIMLQQSRSASSSSSKAAGSSVSSKQPKAAAAKKVSSRAASKQQVSATGCNDHAASSSSGSVCSGGGATNSGAATSAAGTGSSGASGEADGSTAGAECSGLPSVASSSATSAAAAAVSDAMIIAAAATAVAANGPTMLAQGLPVRATTLATAASAPKKAIAGSSSSGGGGSGEKTPSIGGGSSSESKSNGKQPWPKGREARLAKLQEKLDAIYPPFTDVNGVWSREFDAVIPQEGERYAGEGCARCKVSGCDRCGLLFHLKNLMTHAAPRGGQPSRVGASRVHATALVGLLGYTPDPPPVPTELPVRRKKKKGKLLSKGEPAADEGEPAADEGDDKGGDESGEGNEVNAEGDEEEANGVDDAHVTAEAPSGEPPGTHGNGGAGRGGRERALSKALLKQTPRNAESRNFGGHEGRFIHYRSMKLPFHNGQVVLLRRMRLGTNPARNVKFLGNLKGSRAEWQGAFEVARARAEAAGLLLSVFTQYDQLHVSLKGGLDSNHCLHLFNHYRPPEKKMINKWETYMPIALHRTYDRLYRQPNTITAAHLSSLDFEHLFEKLRAKELLPLAPPAEGVQAAAGADTDVLIVPDTIGYDASKSRCLVLVTRRWIADSSCEVGEKVVSRYDDGRDWYPGVIVDVREQEVDSQTTFQYDVQYDDGDYEDDVPHERVLSEVHQGGHWEYLITGPEEASATLPNDQQHPWWPNAEQFVDFVIVQASPKELAKEVAALRESAAERYSHMANDKPYEKPYVAEADRAEVDHAEIKVGVKARQAQMTDGEAKALTADAHDARVAADLQLPQHREELVYMFRKLGAFFLSLVDHDLRFSHLQPHEHDDARISPAALQAIEHRWWCAPVAEIAEGTRQKCDVCETSILDRHWACTVAGCEWEVCLQCHRQGERRRAARRERYERQQRGEKPIIQPWYTTQSGRSSFVSNPGGGGGAATSSTRRSTYVLAPRSGPLDGPTPLLPFRAFPLLFTLFSRPSLLCSLLSSLVLSSLLSSLSSLFSHPPLHLAA